MMKNVVHASSTVENAAKVELARFFKKPGEILAAKQAVEKVC